MYFYSSVRRSTQLIMNFKLMSTTIIQGKIWRWILLWVMFFVGLLVTNEYYFNHNIYLFTFFLVCMVSPFVFFNQILEKTCSSKIEIRLDYDLWSFFIIKNGTEEKYELNDIVSYGVTESSNGYSTTLAFKLKLKNRNAISITMYNEKQSVDQTKTEEVLEAFQSMINNYNKTVNDHEKIALKQTFEESIYGLVTIYILSGMIIIAITLHIIYHKIGTLPLSLFFGGGILMGTIVRRRQDIKRRKKVEI